MRVGLVLGGGGLAGVAYHAGVLCALEHDLGWDPRESELVVGTSAGSLVGALLRSGLRASDLAALSVGAEAPDVPASLTAWLREHAPLPQFSTRHMLRPPRAPHPSLVGAVVRRPWSPEVLGSAMSLLPDGHLDMAEHMGELLEAIPDEWPERDLWLCGLRQRDSSLVVFGRESQPRLRAAVAASCAIPGYFAPVVIDGHKHIDGGVRSPTNADVLAREAERLDLVVVSSPMSGRALGRWGFDSWMRRFGASKLSTELGALRRAELPVIVLEPGPSVRSVMGTAFMDEQRMRGVVGAAFLDAGEELRRSRHRALAAGLARRPRWIGV